VVSPLHGVDHKDGEPSRTMRLGLVTTLSEASDPLGLRCTTGASPNQSHRKI
jgi:hypothetical protein